MTWGPQFGRPARMRRGRPAREPRDGQVERPPEQVDRADLADEPAAEHLEHPVHLDQRQPEPLRLVAVVGGVLRVLLERDGVGDLDRHRPDRSGQPELGRGGP